MTALLLGLLFDLLITHGSDPPPFRDAVYPHYDICSNAQRAQTSDRQPLAAVKIKAPPLQQQKSYPHPCAAFVQVMGPCTTLKCTFSTMSPPSCG